MTHTYSFLLSVELVKIGKENTCVSSWALEVRGLAEEISLSSE
jgi:hypothetical protein